MPQPKTKLDVQIDSVYRELALAGSDDEFGMHLERVVKLEKLRAEIRPKTISPDTLVSAATSIISILLILHYEHANVITSKALGFAPKVR